MYISVLGIGIELYGHVLGPPRVSFDFTIFFFSFFKPFLMVSMEKFEMYKRVIRGPFLAWFGSFSSSKQRLYPSGHFHYVSGS